MIDVLIIAYFVIGIIICGICWWVLDKDNAPVADDILLIAFVWPICLLIGITMFVCDKIDERRGE